MWGAVIGDIVGSRFEARRRRIKTKDFDLFGRGCRYTDDTVCTAAVANILLDDLPADVVLQNWCLRHHGRGYGGWFRRWRDSANPRPYGSFGNGAAMRVSPAALLNRHNPMLHALTAADRVTRVTHNHPEGLRAARATTLAIWLALRDVQPEDIRAELQIRFRYDMSKSVDEIRENYDGTVTAMGSVPQALICALESTSFEDAVRNAVSLGGDADTQAAIAGSVAEAIHGIPGWMIDLVKSQHLRRAKDIRKVLDRLPKVRGPAGRHIGGRAGNIRPMRRSSSSEWRVTLLCKASNRAYRRSSAAWEHYMRSRTPRARAIYRAATHEAQRAYAKFRYGVGFRGRFA